MKLRTIPILAFLSLAFLAVPSVGAEQSFDSGDIAAGASWSFTFTDEYPDGYAYHCHPHPWMTGMVHIMADTDGEVETVHVDILEAGDSADWGYSVEHLAIEVGDTVVWTNTGDLVHTVTRMDAAGGMHEHADHEHDASVDAADPVDNDSPGLTVPLLLVVLALVASVVAARRR